MKKNFGRSGLVNGLLSSMFGRGLFSAVRNAHPSQLTVLNYHRIVDSSSDGFCTFKPNVSAAPEMFALQMDYVKKNYNVISVEQLTAWLLGEKTLPLHSAMITFDDGYFDNLAYAYPILKERGLSAVIFLATKYMGSSSPFYWDFAAYCFCHSKKDHVRLPSGVTISWTDAVSRDKAVNIWVKSVKHLSTDEKQRAVGGLQAELDVIVPDKAFDGLYLTWDQVRELSASGIEFGAHTTTHPILTKVPLSQVEIELSVSKRRVQEETGKPVFSFAYPNGGASDFSPEIVNLVKNTGFDMAFTLMPGPTSYRAVKRSPFTIRRVYVGQSVTLPRFVAKLAGVEKISAIFDSTSGKGHY
jgi:peptidoglycan/xylan/chitin deacetylase (PgdA/CDA1 family)